MFSWSLNQYFIFLHLKMQTSIFLIVTHLLKLNSYLSIQFYFSGVGGTGYKINEKHCWKIRNILFKVLGGML